MAVHGVPKRRQGALSPCCGSIRVAECDDRPGERRLGFHHGGAAPRVVSRLAITGYHRPRERQLITLVISAGQSPYSGVTTTLTTTSPTSALGSGASSYLSTLGSPCL